MKFIKIYISSILISGLLFFACSDLNQDLVQAPSFQLHGEGALNPTSQNFHGTLAINKTMESCKQCHAFDFSGGTAKVSCAASGCHPTIAVHQKGIINPQSQNFHGKYFAATSSEMETCKQCHAADFSGGQTGANCTVCHSGIEVHQAGIVEVTSAKFHGKFIAANNWNLSECSTCHQANYAGDTVSPSCNTCHVNSGGPEACNTCHGDFANPVKIAPARALNGSTDPSYAGVGAHSTHLYNVAVANNVSCGECHVVPQTVNAAGHIDGTAHAEIVFGNFAKTQSSNPAYSTADNKCSNTYCHGNFKFSKASSQYPFVYTEDFIQGNNYSPQWNKVDGSEAKCGTCHGLPPKGHQESDLRSCGTCHQGIVDATGKIIDKSKHMNGQINVFGN